MRARIKKNDIVIAVAGRERFARKTGKVLMVQEETGKIVVQGLNFVKRHTKPSSKNQKGGIIEQEAPLPLSNVMLFCPRCKRGVRVGTKVLPDRTKVRICKRCGETLDR